MKSAHADAYAVCRAIAKREAKNFYYAFRVLPQAKSDAMCAVYAFMRHADDLADDESKSLPERRAAMAAWTRKWHSSREGGSEDPVFVALRDTQQRFGITDALLEELVAGTTLDLAEQAAGTQVLHVQDAGTERVFHIYESQAALEQYCYLVASVVGLVCIRIFGYSDSRAEELAIATGKAFQLTNILRDVREDVERGRVYLPLTLLHEFGVTPERLLLLADGAKPQPQETAMLNKLYSRAEELYGSSGELIPMLDADARGAMYVLSEIYHRLLKKTAEPLGITFHQRVSVPTTQKLAILARGLGSTLAARAHRWT